MKILVVGSGTAGLISALILKKRFPDFTIDVVSSSNIGIIGVGEGSTEHFADFADFMEIDIYDLIKKTDATYKSSIFFEGWGNKNYFHNVDIDYSEKFGQYSYLYANQIYKNDQMHSKIIIENKINSWFLNRRDVKPYNQFHFNTFKLNQYLKDLCLKYNINLFEDEIKNVNFDLNGNISFLNGNNKNYFYDFYIDSSGFRKVLIGKMGAEWQSFSDYLKMNSAITFQTEDKEEYNIWTKAKSMSSGWMFSIPVWGRHGNGYIFDKNYIDEEKAKNEIENVLGHDIEIGKSFSFDPGYLKNVWIKNCLAIGLSGSFVEPLEATSIATSIHQSFILMHKIVNYSEFEINQYNLLFEKIMLNIRDFIFIHYMIEDNKSIFWKDVQHINAPDTLLEKMKVWKNKLPISEDFVGNSAYSLFKSDNFIVVLNGIDWFDKESIKKEFLSLGNNIKLFSEEKVKNLKYYEEEIKKIGHKEYLSIIRNYL